MIAQVTRRVRVLAILLLGAGLSACSGNATPSAPADGDAAPTAARVAFVTNGVDPFWVIAERGARDAAAEFGANLTVHMPAGAVDQKRILEDLLARGVDGVAVSPIAPAEQIEVLNLVASRAHLITHDSDAPDTDRQCFIGVNNYVAGRACGRLVKEALPDGGRVYIFIGRVEQDNARLRRQGVIDELLDRSDDPTRYDAPDSGPLVGPKYTVLGTLTDQFDKAKGKANAEDAMARHPDLDAMVGLFAYNPALCYAALQGAGKLGTIQLIGFDEDPVTLKGIRDGHVYGTIVQDPYAYGYRSVEILNALAHGDTSVIPDDGIVDVPARAIKADNVDAFEADLKKKLGQDDG